MGSRLIRLFLALAWAAPVMVMGQTNTNASGSKIQDGTGNLLTQGTICFSPHNSSNALTPINGSTGPFCYTVTNGAWTTTGAGTPLPNLLTATPSGLNYQLQVLSQTSTLILDVDWVTSISGSTASTDGLVVGASLGPNSTSSGLGSPYLACAPPGSYFSLNNTTGRPNWSCAITNGFPVWFQSGSSPAPGPGQTATIPVVAQMIADAISGGGSLVRSFNTRTGTVAPATGDYSFDLIDGVATPAQMAKATNSTFGVVQPDNDTIDINSMTGMLESKSAGGVKTFNTRTGDVVLNTGDVNAVGTVSNDTTGNANTSTNASHIDGVAVTGTPSAGQAPVATSPTTATWQTVSSGGSSTCPLSTSTQFCITDSTYNASGAGATTTTASFVSSGSTSTTVGSCSTFHPGNGILIPGAGPSSANFIAPLTGCTGTTMAWTGATSTSVSAVAVQHDETGAFNTAIAALTATGGTIYVPNGAGANIYLVNGPLQDTSGANAVLPMPHVNYQGQPPIAISIIGFSIPTGTGGIDPNASTIQFGATSGNLFGGFFVGSGGGTISPFTNVLLNVQNLQVLGPGNPGVVAFNGSAMAAMTLNHVACESATGALPTNTAGGCGLFPQILNNVANAVNDAISVGFATGFRFTEHTHIGRAYAVDAINAFLFDNGTNSGTPGTYDGNAMGGGYLWGFLSTNCVAAGSTLVTVHLPLVDCELISGNDVNDPSNNFRGKISINVPYSPFTITKNGAANVLVENLQLGISDFGAGQFEIHTTGNVAQSSIVNNIFGAENTIANITSGITWSTGTVLGSGYGSHAGDFCISDNSAGTVAPYCVKTNTFWRLAPGLVMGWAGADPFTNDNDTGFSRTASNTVALGNGTFGNAGGVLNLGAVNAATSIKIASIDVCQSNGTNCPPAPTVTNITLNISGGASVPAGCGSPGTISMPGLLITSTLYFAPQTDQSGVTGWSDQSLYLLVWPTAGTFNFRLCNRTSSSITPSAGVNFNVGAQR